MSLNKKSLGAVALVGALATLLVSAQLSSATHPRPKGATPFFVPTVIAYKQCAPPGNSTHNLPLNFASCVPPTQDSNFLTVGTPDANGAAANSSGFVRLVVKGTAPEDVLITSSGTDVRCKPATSATVCNSANTGTAGADYSGQLQGNALIRITDHNNGSPGFTSAGTVQDIPFPVPANCVNTPTDATVGGTCTANTSADAVVPGSVPDGKRGNVEIQTIQISDGGAAGVAGAADATRYATQGLFIP